MKTVILLKFVSTFLLGDSVVYDARFATMDACNTVRAEMEKMKPPAGMTVRYVCVEGVVE